MNPVSRSWVYTKNNWDDEDVAKLSLLTVSTHRCCAEDEGTPHLQGAITFLRSYTFKQITKLFPTFHWEKALCKDAENYCIKGEMIIDINNKTQGSRTDLEAIATMIKEGKSMREVATEYPLQYIRYNKGFQELQRTLAPVTEEYEKLQVLVLVGPPGSGKTREAHEIDPKSYNVPEPMNGSLWFDGYTGQKTILIDDFYGWLKYHTLLQLCDGYPMQLPVKGSFVGKNWKRVIITSNKPPKDWYERTEIDALLRRISKIQILKKKTK